MAGGCGPRCRGGAGGQAVLEALARLDTAVALQGLVLYIVVAVEALVQDIVLVLETLLVLGTGVVLETLVLDSVVVLEAGDILGTWCGGSPLPSPLTLWDPLGTPLGTLLGPL